MVESYDGRIKTLISAVATAVALVAAFAVTGCTASSSSSPRPPAASYYLALGDSLSRGVQPNAGGISVETAQGYPNLVYARVRAAHPTLRLAQLGCPGETTVTMAHGGICRYPGGSQLAAAVAFLRAHRGHVLLVTIDIGANDLSFCGSTLEQVLTCLSQVSDVVARVSVILARVRAAAGPGVPVAGMSYYLPTLAEWRHGTGGQLIAQVAEHVVVAADAKLDQSYTAAGDPVANVSGAFATSNFGDPLTVTGYGSLPRNVARICQWTWECASAPRGPNIHANAAGYQVIANAFLKVIHLR
jgi:lysophospholipase L1-like esterase